MLKETSRSIRWYFGIVAFFSIISGGGSAGKATVFGAPVILDYATLFFGVLFAYISYKFPQLIRTRPQFIQNILKARMGLALITFAWSLYMGVPLIAVIVSLAFSALIYFYLRKNVARMAAEAAKTPIGVWLRP